MEEEKGGSAKRASKFWSQVYPSRMGYCLSLRRRTSTIGKDALQVGSVFATKAASPGEGLEYQSTGDIGKL